MSSRAEGAVRDAAARSGCLTIVPTPLGNLGDMTTRALDAL